MADRDRIGHNSRSRTDIFSFDGSMAADRLWRLYCRIQHAHVVRLPCLSGGALSDTCARSRGRLCVFVQPTLDDLHELYNRIPSQGVWSDQRVCLFSLSMLIVMVSIGVYGPRTRG